MINRVVLVGRLTKDPEVRKTQSGISVTQFTVACDRRHWQQKEEDSQVAQTADFISCVAWRQPADFLGQYGRKGSLVGVDGRLQSRSYDKDGQRVYVTEVVAENLRLLESKNSSTTRNDTPLVTSGSMRKEDFDTDAARDYAAEEYGISSDDLPF